MSQGIENLEFLFHQPKAEPMILGAKEYVGGQMIEDTIISFDAVINPQINSSINVSSHPIESGSNVVDHITKNQTTLSITGIFSNYIEDNTQLLKNNIIGATSNLLPNDSVGLNITKAVAQRFALSKIKESAFEQVDLGTGEIPLSRSQVYWELLENYMNSGFVVSLYTRLKVYDNLIITKLSTKIDPNESNALVCDIDFTQIDIAYMETASIKNDTKKVSKKQNKAGGTAKIDAKPPIENKETSVRAEAVAKKGNTILENIFDPKNRFKPINQLGKKVVSQQSF